MRRHFISTHIFGRSFCSNPSTLAFEYDEYLYLEYEHFKMYSSTSTTALNDIYEYYEFIFEYDCYSPFTYKKIAFFTKSVTSST